MLKRSALDEFPVIYPHEVARATLMDTMITPDRDPVKLRTFGHFTSKIHLSK
jgi:hypothetical protein